MASSSHGRDQTDKPGKTQKQVNLQSCTVGRAILCRERMCYRSRSLIRQGFVWERQRITVNEHQVYKANDQVKSKTSLNELGRACMEVLDVRGI
eukprot:6483016-Amphidinium_carterae.1